MSVEISGPKGYDFQYLNSLLFALEYLDKDEIEIYIEKKNGEDAQIIFNQDGTKYIIDIQVKNRSAEEIDLQSFVEWISHFESKSVSCSLLNKLDQDNNRYAVFISDARSKDDVSLFVDEGVIHTELRVGFNNEYLNKIKGCIKNCYSDSSSISIARKTFLERFIDDITNNKLRNILKKIKLREKYTEVYSTEKIRYLLNKKFYIPQDETDDVIIKLLDRIRHSRGTDLSITIDLMHIIDKYSGNIILNRNENYIKRIERESCVEILSTNNVLLLTGVSFCGKSYLARDIAQEYLENGYKVKQVGELYGDDGGISFIRHRSIEDRLLILEDPFGQVETKKDAISILNEIRNLIRESKPNRKIIITSRKDILLDATSKKAINECSIDSHCWIDLTLYSSEKMIELWGNYYGNSIESKALCNDVIKWLRETEKTSSLQLGHIANIYSAKKELSDLISLRPVDIISIASIDSNDLAGSIDRRGSVASKIFIALGLSCNTYKTVTLNDLAFILSDCEEKPGIYKDRKEHTEFTLNQDLKDNENKNYPKYNWEYKLDNEYKSELKYFQQHGYIQIDNVKRIMFVHPIYHFATQLLLKKQFVDVLEQQEVIDLVQNILSSLSINANLCTLTMIENLYKENPDNELKRLILIGLDSIFPSVRDKVIMFFDRRINDLNESEQKRFVNALVYDQSINNDGICWYDGIPYFNVSERKGFSYRDWLQDKISNYEIDSLLKKTIDGIDISSEEMWNSLNIKNSGVIPLNILEKALSYDESFIRGKAIRLIFENYAFEFEKVDEYLNSHEHPGVIYSLFRGALSSWIKYSSESRCKILDYFKSSLNIMSVAIKTKKFLENFEDEHSEESIDWSEVEEKDKIELWNVWHEVFVVFLNKFPSKYVRMNEPHMVGVIEHSLEYIKDEEKVIELSIAWFNWLDRYLQYNLPNDYGMSVAQYLMDGTGNKFSYRENIFEMMLSTEKTSFITSNIKVFIDCWNDLSDKEKRIIFNLYKSTRKDVNWIKAVSLSRKTIPYEIQVEILGESIDNKSVSDIVDILLEKGLLEQCLNIHCGYPQPLWWNGYHHDNCKLWDAVIVEVLRRNELNRAFDIALREVIDLLYNHDDRRITNIQDVYEQDLLKIPNKRKLVFERLLYDTVDQNQCNKRLWDLLLQYSSQEEIELYFNKIAEDIELVQYWQINDGDLFALFDKSIIFKKIYPRLEVDNCIKKLGEYIFMVYEMINDSKNTFEAFKDKELRPSILKMNEEEILKRNDKLEKLKASFVVSITKIYKDNPPRLFLSNKFMRNIMKKMEIISPELEDLIEKNRVRLIEITRDLRQKYDDHYDLVDWIN
ncbi:hypothetical protein CLRAG_29430 [Clostridium ragsdalei P11]|uniref:Novel STAND NTPase 3 domain-containing protein n=1 Tax=Clostridium ragsdalei P11 TaxID=1353534 RepID=A0A1A6AND4_9CLOT|nr:hypothetical protein [Clostridium ragsdalei]OBR91579.1 hypothetical protein CLRAG_29430 [Clostridium ragsdalei P11]